MRFQIATFACCMTLVGSAFAAETKPAEMSCGQHMAAKAVMPKQMAETMTAVADMVDAHIGYMKTIKGKDSMTEINGLKAVAKQHRMLATQFANTAKMMQAGSTWPNVPHDMAKMMSDKQIQASMQKMLTTHQAMLTLLQNEVTEMQKMMTPPAAAVN